jgi:uncharacterized membrane protein YraQ (UPF0718 family)
LITVDYPALVIWVIAVALWVMAYRRSEPCHTEGLAIAWKQAAVNIPRIALAILISGFFSQLVPTELVARWLGQGSGARGILIGSLVGGLTPGGPILCFPIVVVLFKAGASVPSLISFLTAWSVFAVHRMLAYEIPMLGIRFVVIRFMSCALLPPLAGSLAALASGVLHIDI